MLETDNERMIGQISETLLNYLIILELSEEPSIKARKEIKMNQVVENLNQDHSMVLKQRERTSFEEMDDEVNPHFMEEDEKDSKEYSSS